MYVFIAIAVMAGVASLIISRMEKSKQTIQEPETVIKEEANLDEKEISINKESTFTNPNLKLNYPEPNTKVTSPLQITGEARGNWFFEASFPVSLTNWDGLIIAEGIATTTSDWMTTDFIPFTASLEFVNPYNPGDPDFMKKGTLILKKDNPSDLPENDDALEIPVSFAL